MDDNGLTPIDNNAGSVTPAMAPANIMVMQRDVALGPFDFDELCWLYGRRYLADDDLVMPPDGQNAVLLRIFLDAQLSKLDEIPSSIFFIECPACGNALNPPGTLQPYSCPACGEEFSVSRLRMLFFNRAHTSRSVGVPQLASMSGYDWVELLREKPQFVHFALLDRLNGTDWVKLLRAVPPLADYCRWSVLDAEHWRTLLNEGLCERAVAEFALAEPSMQIPALLRQPQLEHYVNFSRYSLADWLRLLRKCPQMAPAHPEWCAKLNPTQVIAFLEEYGLPETLLSMLPSSQLTGIDWLRVMIKNPRCARLCHWSAVVRHIERLPSPDPVVRGQSLHDDSMKYHSGQHSCAISYPELASMTQEIYRHADCMAMTRELTQEELFLLFDYMQWEEYLPLDDLEPDRKIAVLAMHPDFGTVQMLWPRLPPWMAAEIAVRSPSLFPELYYAARKALTREQWNRLLAEVPNGTPLMNLIAEKVPLSFADIIQCRHRGCAKLRARILRWYLLALGLALLWYFLTLP